MDDLLGKLGSVAVSAEPTTKFDELYKNWGKSNSSQESRRKDLLEAQKSNRLQQLDAFRGILNSVQDDHDDSKTGKKFHFRPTIYAAGFYKVKQSYKNVLMHSEWMQQKPADFHENWFVVPCPKGTRMLVVAIKGSTKCFNKYGQFCSESFTALPGGNPRDRGYTDKCAVLDCFYHESSNTMYVLDILAWNKNTTMADGEAEFRYYWLKCNLQDLNDINKITTENEIKFEILEKITCDKKSFNEFMMKYPQFPGNAPVLDGLLFYHKRAHYFSGKTPLVVWLFPFMVQDMLGSDITVHDAYLAEKPQDYKGCEDYIQQFQQKYEKQRKDKRNQKLINKYSMDTSTPDEHPNQVGLMSKNKQKHAKTESEMTVEGEQDISEESNGQTMSFAGAVVNDIDFGVAPINE